MVIEDIRRTLSRPDTKGTAQNSRAVLTQAPPLDRLAAASLDALTILMPLIMALSSPFKKQMIEALILDQEFRFAVNLVWLALSVLALLMAYQVIMIRFWGATLGKLFFGLRVVNVWSQRPPTVGACVIRSSAYVGSLLLLGVPFLSVISNQKRRPIHDKLADTEVITLRGLRVAAPTLTEASFVRGVYAAVSTLVFSVALLVGLGVVSSFKEFQGASWLDGLEDSRQCKEVSEALDEAHNDEPDQRLSMAMALFAAGLVQQSCLSAEVDDLFHRQRRESPLAYLAKAFVNAEDGDVSNSYLEQVCKLDAQSESCKMSQLVNVWASDNWSEVEESFRSMVEPLSWHAMVWKVRYRMRTEGYEEVLSLLDRLGWQPALASFVNMTRVKALWRTERHDEARLVSRVALESLDVAHRSEVASFMCYEEMIHFCAPHAPFSCEYLERNASVSEDQDSNFQMELANLVRAESCSESQPQTFYESRIDETVDEEMASLLTAIIQHLESASEDLNPLFSLVEKDGASELLRREAFRRLVSWATNVQSMDVVIDKWRQLEGYTRRFVGLQIVQRLLDLRENSLAHNFGSEFLDLYKTSPTLNKQLIVAAYRLGNKEEVRALWQARKDWEPDSRYGQSLLLGKGPPTQRRPASVDDEFIEISRLLSQELGER